MRKHKKWLSLLLSASLVMSCPTSAFADETVQNKSEVESVSLIETDSETETDMEVLEESETDTETPASMDGEGVEPTVSWNDHGDGKIDLAVQNYSKGADVKAVKFYIWSENKGQDDLTATDADAAYAYQLNTRTHNDDLGMYHVHVYEEKNDGSLKFVCKITGEVTSIERDEPVLAATDKNGDEKTFALSLEKYEKPSDTKEVRVAIWSENGGQDDLNWYTMKDAGNGDFTYDFQPAAHKTPGQYQLHVYELKTNNSLKFVTKASLNVSAASAEAITVAETDQSKGTCKLIATGVTCPSGVSRVQFPVWSKADQSDICWYQAERQTDGSYVALMDIAKHKNNMGLYQIHAYADTGNGFMNKIGNATVEFKAAEAAVTATKKDQSFVLETKDIVVPGGLSKVRYAVWSEEKGQDDLKWFETSYDAATASAKYTMTMEGFKSYGAYQVHCYGETKSGSLVFLGKNTFNVEKPSLESMEITTDNNSGAFIITLTGLNSDSGITDVRIPVWSKTDQSDIVWYTAEKTAEGTYVVKSSIAKHKFNVGTYVAHVYVTEKSGLTSFLKGDNFTFEKTVGEIMIGAGNKQKTYPVTIKNVSIPAGAKSVSVAVWSENGGQDDLKWYTLTGNNGGDYSGTIDISNHKTQGLYHVHVYADNQAGGKVILGTTTFTVESTASLTAVVTGEDPSNGSFHLKITVDGTNSDISKIQVPVWSTSNQSDIYWYTADKQSDGTYSCTVNIGNHKANLGNYIIHLYPTFTNGIRIKGGDLTYNFNPPNVLAVTKTGNGTRKLTLKNASAAVTNVRFAVWSDDKGQDDIVWYDAEKQADGSWTATVKSSKHKSAGNYQVHCYQNNAFACNTTFTFDKSEMLKEGWYYENGYKFYYQAGKKLTNLTSIIGAQGSYVAKVNRTTCTITIYANDPNGGGYIIPVIAFTCSVGLPGTPTTPGTHYTFAKYRWKELMGPSWGQYATKFTSDGIYFHSVAGINTTSYNLNYIDYNNLGIPASHGCVRLCVRDAKWIYDNCPLGMKVIVYDSGDPGPYGKPATIKIPAGQTWDPTDPAIR